jgi:predicted transcriptional regulator
MRAVHDDRSLGLLVIVADEGPLSVIELLDMADLCESDLHGTVTELRAADLIDEAEVNGHRGYAATDLALEALALLRGGSDADADS